MTNVLKAFVFKLKPKRAQRSQLAQHAGASRYVYNRMLAQRKAHYETTGETLSKYTQIKQLPVWKADAQTTWLKDIHSQVLQQAIVDLDDAYQHFFRRVQTGEAQAGFPRFKKKRMVGESFRYQQGVKVDGRKLYLPKIGWVKFHKSQAIPSPIKRATVRKKASGWYVSVLCEVEVEPLPPIDQEVGLDVGISHLVVTSTGHQYRNPKSYRRLERQLARAQRKLSRRKKGSNNRTKQAMKVARIHERIANIRHDHQHKVSTQLVRENQAIYAETLHVKGMVKHRKLAKSIQDASMSGLLEKIAYKCEWYGRSLHKIDQWFPSSKTCSTCGHVVEAMPLHIRNWRCNQCHSQHDRDINAAKNILAVGQAERVNACGERVRPSSVTAMLDEARIPSL